MTHPVRLREEADLDLAEAAFWYERQREGLGHEFLDEALSAIDRIGQRPHAFPAVRDDIRRALMYRFPFAIFYKIVGDTVVVMAVMHVSRHPRKWQTRR